jgi:hypothetical protein
MPVTTPVVATLAIVAALVVQVPPVTVEVSALVLAAQMVAVPEIVPAEGEDTTLITLVAVAVPHVPVTVYVIVAVPVALPLTTPAAVTEATAAFELAHVPPVTVLLNVVVPARQTVVAPESVPAVVAAFTVIVLVAVPVPQALVFE